MSDVRDVAAVLATHTCEMCGDTYPSMRAAWMCEERDIEEARTNRKPPRHIMRPMRDWLED